jgi:hypothetical protein
VFSGLERKLSSHRQRASAHVGASAHILLTCYAI